MFTPKCGAQAGCGVFDGLSALVHHSPHAEEAVYHPIVAPDRCLVASFLGSLLSKYIHIAFAALYALGEQVSSRVCSLNVLSAFSRNAFGGIMRFVLCLLPPSLSKGS